MTLKNASRYEYEFAFDSGFVTVGADRRRIDGLWRVVGDRGFEVSMVPEERVDDVAAKVADYERRYRELSDEMKAVSDEFYNWSQTFMRVEANR